MLHHAYRPVLASVLTALLGTHAATAATLSDDFNGDAGSAPDAGLWTSYGTHGNDIIELDGASNLVVDTAIPNSSHRSFVHTNASDFDPFTSPLTIELDGIAIVGDPEPGFHTAGFVLLGRSAADATSGYYPNGGGMAYGFAVSIRNGGATGYDIHINEYSDVDTDSNPSDQTILYATYALNGAPTGLTLVVDGQSLEIQVDGTTFTAGDSASVVQPLSDNFTSANLSDGGSLVSRLSIGAVNAGPVVNGAKFTVDSVNVVPEPAALGLMGLGLLLAAGRRR